MHLQEVEGEARPLTPEEEDYWRDRLQVSADRNRQRSVQAMLDHAAEMYAFKETLETKQGGSWYTSYCKTFLDIGETWASMWKITGERAPELCSVTTKLPADLTVITELARQDNPAVFAAALERISPHANQVENLSAIRAERAQLIGPVETREPGERTPLSICDRAIKDLAALHQTYLGMQQQDKDRFMNVLEEHFYTDRLV